MKKVKEILSEVALSEEKEVVDQQKVNIDKKIQ